MAGQVQHLICQDSLRKKKKKKRQMRQFFLQSVYILWTRAHSVLIPSRLKCIKKKKKKDRNGAVYYEMHLNLTEPLQRRQTLLQRRGEECVEECRLPTPQPKSAFHGSAARTRELWHIYYSSWCTGSCLARRARLFVPKCWGVTEKYIMLPRSCLKKPTKKKIKWRVLHQTASQPASQRCLRNKRINLRYWNWHEAAGWMPTHISNWDVISQKEKTKQKTKNKTEDDYEELAVYCRCEIRVRRDSGSLWI